jgi:S-adenosyl methyltransferase
MAPCAARSHYPDIVQQKPRIDTSVAHSARVYNYWLGGKDNFAADREAAERALAAMPGLRFAVQANRAFLARSVRFLAREAGIRQFLDIGTGIPTASNTHEVAQSVAPQARIVYVDNDPMVLNHARVLLTSAPEGACDYLEADLREPDTILDGAAQTLDFFQPVALMLIGVLHLIEDEDDPPGLVSRLIARLPAGSYLTISHPASDIAPEATKTVKRELDQSMVQRSSYRTREQVTAMFSGLELVDPGITTVARWRPSSENEALSPANAWAGVALKR